MSTRPPTLPPAGAVLAARAAAVAYVVVGLWTMLAASPKVPYADSYRFLHTFATLPFPDDALASDNGHREVLPNLVRIAEAEWFAANQWLQILGGVLLAPLAAWLFLRRLRGAGAPFDVAAGTLVCVGLFWLGNARKLGHGSEALHLFLVLASLAVGLGALTGPPAQRDRGPWLAAAAGLVATSSFGSGIACFAALFAALALQRAPLRRWWPVLLGAGISTAVLLHGGSGDPAIVEIGPAEQFGRLLQWLGAPFVWALSPLLDTAHAARLPLAILSEPAGWIAGPVQALCGDHLAARWPSVGFGGLGLLLLLAATWRAWRRRDPAPREVFALGLGWFGCAVGALVVIARLSFFRGHPDQVSSQRYVPWSMIFWTGLLLVRTLRPGGSARAAVWTALGWAALLAPSQVWTGRYAWRLQTTAEITAAGAAVAVLDARFPLVETQWDDLRRAVPVLRQSGSAMFAWPETALLGARPGAIDLVPVAIEDLVVASVDNRFDAPGSRANFRARVRGGRLLLLDGAGVACGIAVRDEGSDAWIGWLQGSPDPVGLRAARLR